MKNIVNDIKTAAEAEGYKFIYGPRVFLNYFASTTDITSTEFIFSLFPVRTRSSSIVNDSTVETWRNEITILLGRKFDVDIDTAESDEYSSLDETYQQKHERRLYALQSALFTFLESFTCGSDYRISDITMDDEINRTDENIDFVKMELTILYDEADSSD